MSQLIVLKPRLSEKAYGLTHTTNTYVFQVPNDANKHTVAEAVAKQFKVGVVSVNITNVAGKAKRTYMNKRGKFVIGNRNDIKKAYVTLVKGESIPIFAAEEEAAVKAEKVQEKIAKKTKKITAKETK